MQRLILLALSVLGFTTLGVQAASFNLTLTPEANGADTRFSWTYTGTPTIGTTPLTGSSIGISGLAFGSGSTSSPHHNVTGSTGTAFTSALSSIVGLNTGLVLTNTTTLDSRAFTEILFYASGNEAYVVFTWSQANTNMLDATTGQELVVSGPASGSFLSGLAYSNFTSGSWTLDQGVYYNFDPVLTVGGAVPEPSTYGLMLGGLVLAGAVMRRRKILK